MFAKILLACALFGSLQAIPSDPDCPIVCPALFNPVCATDGTTFREFSNECELKSLNCRLAPRLKAPFAKTTLNLCRSETVTDLKTLLVKMGNLSLDNIDCKVPCHPILKQVCISNGQYRLMAEDCTRVRLNCAVGANGAVFQKIADSC